MNSRTLEEAPHIFLNSRMLLAVVVGRENDLRKSEAGSTRALDSSFAQPEGNRDIFLDEYQELATRFILNRITISNDSPSGSFEVALRPLFCDDNLRGDLPMRLSMEIPKPFNLVPVQMPAFGSSPAEKWGASIFDEYQKRLSLLHEDTAGVSAHCSEATALVGRAPSTFERFKTLWYQSHHHPSQSEAGSDPDLRRCSVARLRWVWAINVTMRKNKAYRLRQTNGRTKAKERTLDASMPLEVGASTVRKLTSVVSLPSDSAPNYDSKGSKTTTLMPNGIKARSNSTPKFLGISNNSAANHSAGTSLSSSDLADAAPAPVDCWSSEPSYTKGSKENNKSRATSSQIRNDSRHQMGHQITNISEPPVPSESVVRATRRSAEAKPTSTSTSTGTNAATSQLHNMRKRLSPHTAALCTALSLHLVPISREKTRHRSLGIAERRDSKDYRNKSSLPAQSRRSSEPLQSRSTSTNAETVSKDIKEGTIHTSPSLQMRRRRTQSLSDEHTSANTRTLVPFLKPLVGSATPNTQQGIAPTRSDVGINLKTLDKTSSYDSVKTLNQVVQRPSYMAPTAAQWLRTQSFTDVTAPSYEP